MAKNRSSFNAAQGLFDTNSVQYIQEAHEVHIVQHEHGVQEINRDSLEGTRGKKGYKLPRINMAFTLNNHEYIKKASRRAGISITEYVNLLIDKDRKKNDK